jgi:stearoyl-CoA desaturase (Delta-9 desaturase)
VCARSSRCHNVVSRLLALIARWLDNSRSEGRTTGRSRRIDVARVVPFITLHLACAAVLWVGVSPVAAAVCAASYLLRMFAITAFYHRYFAHRAFRAGRVAQFLFAVLGATATQRGPLWWAAHHRTHHRHADGPGDPHRPADGLFWSHMGWFLSDRHFVADMDRVRDWRRFPELVWLDRFDLAVPVLYAAGLFGFGAWLQGSSPGLGTSGAQMLVWGYVVSTVLLIHATLLVNSLAHVWGHRRFETLDASRNNALIALLTLGEGWHNNHHRFAASARQGFYWWQVDVSYWMLRLLATLGIVRDLRPVPAAILDEGRR